MKAMVVRAPGGPEALVPEELPRPTLRRNDVLVRVAACGVCFHDVVVRNGTLKRGVSMPLIPGHEISGIVEEVGPDVTLFQAGERVASVQRRHICGHCRFCRSGHESACREHEFLGDFGLNGGYAEFVCVEDDNLAHVPEGVALEDAAIVACAIGTELNAIREVAKLRPGERVLINGAGGGLGIHAVELARLSGAEVIAVTGSEGKREAILAAGAHRVVVAEHGSDFSAEVRSLTAGEGVDVAIDNVGSPTFEPMRRSLGMMARWVFVGQLSGAFVSLNPAQLFLRGISVLSALSTSRAQLEDALALVARGALTPRIAARFPLSKAREAHRMVESAAPTGRLLLCPTQP